MSENKTNPRQGKIRITDHYYYTVDSFGNHIPYWIGVKEKMVLGKKGVGTGQFREVAESIGFYQNLESMATACSKDAAYRKIEAGEIKTIEEHLAELRRMNDEIKEAIGGY